MSTKNPMFSHTKKSKRKILAAIILFAFSTLMIVGLVAAYYSDMFAQPNDITSGTLRISGTYTATHNDQVKALNTINNLNPGDVIVIKCTITNLGNKSAWIRDSIQFDNITAFSPYLEVYAEDYSQEDFISGTINASTKLEITEGGVATSDVRVIDGTGAGAETEGGGGYNYIGTNTYDVVFTIYFLPTATNASQGTTFTVTVGAQALQFRNNDLTLPDNAAWDNVVAVVE